MDFIGHIFISKYSDNTYLSKYVQTCNAEEKLWMLKNRGHLPYNYIGELLLLPTKFHKNESYMENTQYFSEASNIARVHINIDTSKEKVINVHIKDRKNIHFKACV